MEYAMYSVHKQYVCLYKSIYSNITKCVSIYIQKELDGPAVSALSVRLRKLSNVRKGQSSDG
jgi:hypothetical protein